MTSSIDRTSLRPAPRTGASPITQEAPAQFLEKFDNGKGLLAREDDFEIEPSEVRSAGGTEAMAADYRALAPSAQRQVRPAMNAEVRTGLELVVAHQQEQPAVAELLKSFRDPGARGTGAPFFVPHRNDPSQVAGADGKPVAAEAFADALAKVASLGDENLVAMAELISPRLLRGPVGQALAADPRLKAMFNPLDLAGSRFTSRTAQQQAADVRQVLGKKLGLPLEGITHGLTLQHLKDAGLVDVSAADPRARAAHALLAACREQPGRGLDLLAVHGVLAGVGETARTYVTGATSEYASDSVNLRVLQPDSDTVLIQGQLSEYADGTTQLALRHDPASGAVHIKGQISRYSDGSVTLALKPQADGSLLLSGSLSAYASGKVDLRFSPVADGFNVRGSTSAHEDSHTGSTGLAVRVQRDGEGAIVGRTLEGGTSRFATGQVRLTEKRQGDSWVTDGNVAGRYALGSTHLERNAAPGAELPAWADAIPLTLLITLFQAHRRQVDADNDKK